MLLTACAGDLLLEHQIGVAPMHAMSKRAEVALGFGFCVLLCAPLMAACAWAVSHWVLDPLDLTILLLPMLVAVLFLVVNAVRRLLEIIATEQCERLATFAPLLLLNGLLFGTALIVLDKAESLLGAVGLAIALAFGYLVLLLVFSTLRERLDAGHVPAPFAGSPITLLTLGILAMCFEAFLG